MPEMEVWEWLLLAASGYVALVALVRLMVRRRDAVLDELRAQAERERRRISQEKSRPDQRKFVDKNTRKAG